MKAVVTGVDTYVWMDGLDRYTAEKGETIDVSEKEFGRIEGALSKPAAVKAGFPGSHADLDALASENDVVFSDGTKSVADKQAALVAAGVEPPADDA